MRVKEIRGYLINPAILNEFQHFTMNRASHRLGRSQNFLRSIAKDGRKSPVTKKVVKLEVALNAANVLVTSEAAFDRFQRRLNGEQL